jgi:DNA repair protein RadC
MYQNRATVTASNSNIAGNVTGKNQMSAGSPVGNDASSGERKRMSAVKYIPVYHVELVRDRVIKTERGPAIRNSDDVVAILGDELLKADREKLVCLMLNTKNVVIGIDTVSVGSLSASIAHPREIFKSAILKNAAAIILSHNHPSGDPSPSQDDIRLTERISKAGEILGIKLLDHVIIGALGIYSFSNAGRLP